jgi:hypothetical protein
MPQRVIQKPLDSTPDPDNDYLLIDSLTEGVRRVSVRTAASVSGPVVSVNEQTGAVVLDADDISDTSTSKKFVTAAHIDKIDLILTDQGSDTFLSGDGVYRSPSISDVANIGTGVGIFTDISSGTIRLKSLQPGANTRFDVISDTIVVNSFGSSNVIREIIPASTPSPYVISHNLNNENLFVEVFDNVTKENLTTTITRTDANNLTVSYESELVNDTVVLIISGELASTSGLSGETIEFTASNGLTMDDTDVQLGGVVDRNTVITRVSTSLSNFDCLGLASESIPFVGSPNTHASFMGIGLYNNTLLGLQNASTINLRSGAFTTLEEQIDSGEFTSNGLFQSDLIIAPYNITMFIKLEDETSTLEFNYNGMSIDKPINCSASEGTFSNTSLVTKNYVDNHQLRSYTVGSLPSASPAGRIIYVSNETGGAVPAFSDGTNWRRVTDRNIVS